MHGGEWHSCCSLLDGLEPNVIGQAVALHYGIDPIRAPHACHIVFGGHRAREHAIVKKKDYVQLCR